MNLGWLIRTAAGLVVLCAIAGCAAGAPAPMRESTAPADTKLGAGSPDAPAPLNGPVPGAPPPVPQRDIVKTASMTITVGDLVAAADKAASIATDTDGRVDNRTENGGSDAVPARIALTVRVPVAKLDGVITELKKLGTVQTLNMTAEDVTAQRVDLDARITALQTSVDRLLAIMRDAKDPDALIKAEDALSERQAELDGLRAQRAVLGEQIAYSTVTLDLVAERAGGPAPKQYQGFFGQVHRGWDALVSTGSNVLLLVGLLLPWAGAAAVGVGLLYGLYRLAMSRR